MRRPLEDVLVEHPDMAGPASFEEAEERLRQAFAEARKDANAFAAERLEEIYEVAERSLALSAAIPKSVPARPEDLRADWRRRLPDLGARFGAGLLLAAAAPLLVDESMALTIGCAVGALLSFAVAFRRGDAPDSRPADKAAIEAKFAGLLSAADQALHSMTAPRAIAAPQSAPTALRDDDVLAFLQDALAISRESDDGDNRALHDNAARIVRRAGFEVQWEGGTEHFDVMVDPDLEDAMLLKPALVHKSEPSRTVAGVIVKGGR